MIPEKVAQACYKRLEPIVYELSKYYYSSRILKFYYGGTTVSIEFKQHETDNR